MDQIIQNLWTQSSWTISSPLFLSVQVRLVVSSRPLVQLSHRLSSKSFVILFSFAFAFLVLVLHTPAMLQWQPLLEASCWCMHTQIIWGDKMFYYITFLPSNIHEIWMPLSHVFEISSISNEKPSISIKIPKILSIWNQKF